MREVAYPLLHQSPESLAVQGPALSANHSIAGIFGEKTRVGNPILFLSCPKKVYPAGKQLVKRVAQIDRTKETREAVRSPRHPSVFAVTDLEAQPQRKLPESPFIV